MLNAEKYSQKEYWRVVKPVVRQVEREDAAILVDDTIEEKPHTDESELITWHYDHSQGRSVKGINLLNFIYHSKTSSGQEISFPVAYETVTKPDVYQDPKSGKWKRRSLVSKNELVRERLKVLCRINQIKFKYVINDIWFSSKDNMKWIKNDLKKDFVMALKGNRLVALSEQDKVQGRFETLEDLGMVQ